MHKMNLQNTLIDNSDDLKLVETLKTLITNDAITEIKIATGFWDLPGTALLVDELTKFLSKDGHKLQLLIGKDPEVKIYQLKHPEYKDESYPKDYILREIAELDVKTEYQAAVKMLLDYGKEKNSDDSQKLEIHIFNKNEKDENQFLHSKCYIFQGDTEAFGIIGSSNFTQKGLEGNSELNYLDCDGSRVTATNTLKGKKSHLEWFTEKWTISEDWTKEFIEQILKSPKNKNIPQLKENTNQNENTAKLKIVTPYEAYIKSLISQYGAALNTGSKLKPEDYLPADKNFKILSYQLEAVNQGFSIMHKHGGFILADVVGLGKTFTAIMIIKRYLLETSFSKPILIITPPAIKNSWIESIDYFDTDATCKIKDYIYITTIGCLDSLDEDSGQPIIDDFDDDFSNKNYGLVVIDESHRFRNGKTVMYEKLETLLQETNAYVVLLSATPQNNKPNDLANQIFLIPKQMEKRNSTLTGLGEHGNNLEAFFAEKDKIYQTCIKDYRINSSGNKIPKDDTQKKSDLETLKKITQEIRDCVVNQLVIRRTRTDLAKYYKKDMDTQGITFPKIAKPVGIPYKMTTSLAKLFNKTLDIIAYNMTNQTFSQTGNALFNFGGVSGKDYLGYFRFAAILFLKSQQHQSLYAFNSKAQKQAGGSISVQSISERLQELMEILLVKRLESSKDAFEESLTNLCNNTQNMIDMFDENRIFICPDFDVNKYLTNDNRKTKGGIHICLDEIASKAKDMNKKHNTQKNHEFKSTDFQPDYVQKLKDDLTLVKNLLSEWQKEKDDPKRDEFVASINSLFLDKGKNPSGKLVVFTECIATQTMLAKYLLGKYKVLSITADNRKDMQDVIAANFDANYKGEQRNDYQILITTDVLAEGVNLHRANTIINYDSPWNATRLMQRLGRINRIGSTAKMIYSYNFYPSEEGDAQINLQKRTLIKLQAFHNLFSEDSKIYTNEEKLVKHVTVNYDEDESENPAIKYIGELNDYKKSNEEKYAELESITEPIYSAVSVKNNDQISLHILLTKNKCNVFYEVHYTNNTANQIGQLALIDVIKKYATLSLLNISDAEYLQADKKAIDSYNNELLNQNVVVKSTLKAGKKEQNSAKNKIRSLAQNLNSSQQSDLNQIMGAVTNNNHGLIYDICAQNTDDLTAKEISDLINTWLKKCNSTNSNMNNAAPSITFVIKTEK